MVKLENISYKINDKIILNDINCIFEQGKISLILGANGAGKSTLIKIISGENKTKSGSIFLNNHNIEEYSFSEMAKFRAVLSQNLELSFPLTVFEVVIMGRYPHFKGKIDKKNIEICLNAMDLFNVADLKDRNYLTLSGGEKQRVQFARVFSQIWQNESSQQRILLLDEPLTYLDIFYQYDLMDKITNFILSNHDVTVVGVVHDLNIAAKYADNIMFLKNNSIYKYGETKSIITEENIYEVFNIKVKTYIEVQ